VRHVLADKPLYRSPAAHLRTNTPLTAARRTLLPGIGASLACMTLKEQLHLLVDQLGDDQVPRALELLEELAGKVPQSHRPRPEWFGALDGDPDLVERSAHILRARGETSVAERQGMPAGGLVDERLHHVPMSQELSHRRP
jgi:hypothetical protein